MNVTERVKAALAKADAYTDGEPAYELLQELVWAVKLHHEGDGACPLCAAEAKVDDARAATRARSEVILQQQNTINRLKRELHDLKYPPGRDVRPAPSDEERTDKLRRELAEANERAVRAEKDVLLKNAEVAAAHSVLADVRDECVKLRACLEAAADAIDDLVSNDIDCLDYPDADCYGERLDTDVAAPLWTEAGLYGRVGKEAARTLLARRKRAVEVLDRLRAAVEE